VACSGRRLEGLCGRPCRKHVSGISPVVQADNSLRVEARSGAELVDTGLPNSLQTGFKARKTNARVRLYTNAGRYSHAGNRLNFRFEEGRCLGHELFRIVDLLKLAPKFVLERQRIDGEAEPYIQIPEEVREIDVGASPRDL